MITISGKLLGKNKSLFSDWNLDLNPQLLNHQNQLNFRDLLTQIVQAEIDRFKTRQEQRKLISVLSPERIKEGALKGKITMGGQEFSHDINSQAMIETVLQAFEDGFYYVFIDDQQIESLEQIIDLKENSQLLFLRLVPLVGG